MAGPMRSFQLIIALTAQQAIAQFPLPYWEAFDSSRVVLSQLPKKEVGHIFHVGDTLWANGCVAVPITDLDTVVVDQCCIDPDPPILLGRLRHWPVNHAGERLPLFLERLDADTTSFFLMSEWRSMPDTMIPLTAQPGSLVRYVWGKSWLEVQTDHYGSWRSNNQLHLIRSTCTVEARDSLKMMRCIPDALHRTSEPALTLLFAKDKLLEVFPDNSNNTIDSWGYFDRAKRATLVTARYKDMSAILLSSGEVLLWAPEQWKLVYREPSIYRGECDCE